MQPMSDGMNVNPEILNQTLLNKLAQATIREAQMEAGIQQLMMENQQLHAQVQELSETQDDTAAEQE